MNYLTMQTRTAQYLDRTDLTTKIADWVNDTRKDLALKYDFDYLYTEATMTTSANSGTYALPTDYLGHLTIWAESRKLMRIGPREFDELTGFSETAPSLTPTLFTNVDSVAECPEYYIDRGMNIQFFPEPDKAYTITLKYYAQPTDFTIDADEDYISRFHFEAVIFGTALRGAVFLDDSQKIEIFTKAYQASVSEMVKREKEKFVKDTHIRFKSWKDYDLSTFKRLVRIDNENQ